MTVAHRCESPVGAGLTRDQGITNGQHFAKEPNSAHALRVIDGERKAHEFLARLRAQQAGPDELANIVSMLNDATLGGFCRVLSKALEVGRA